MKQLQRVLFLGCALSAAGAAYSCGQLFDARAGNGVASGGGNTPATLPASTDTTNTGSDPNSTGTTSPASNSNVTSNTNVNTDTNTTSTTPASTTPSAAVVSYATQAGPIISNSCAPCHTGGFAPELSSYSKSKAGFSTGGGLDTVNNGSMPKSGSPQLSAADKATLVNWAAGGYQP